MSRTTSSASSTSSSGTVVFSSRSICPAGRSVYWKVFAYYTV